MRDETRSGNAQVSFSPDGTLLATVVDYRGAHLWDAWTGVRLQEPLAHPGIANAIFTPDGSRLLTTSHQGTVRVWDLEKIPRPQNLAEWITAFSGVDVRHEAQEVLSPDAADPEKGWSIETFSEQAREMLLLRNSIFQQEADWYAAIRRQQLVRCARFQQTAAREAEARQDWFAAEFHWRHLLQADPDNAEFKTRLQSARKQLQK